MEQLASLGSGCQDGFQLKRQVRSEQQLICGQVGVVSEPHPQFSSLTPGFIFCLNLVSGRQSVMELARTFPEPDLQAHPLLLAWGSVRVLWLS